MNTNFLKLVQSLDALFPVGGYTLSNGMETYVQKGIVHDSATLKEHIDSYLYMLSYNELAFAARAAENDDICYLDSLYSALKSPYEIRSGSMKQCMRFLKIHTELDKYPGLEKYRSDIRKGICDGHYCIAMGIFIRELETDIRSSLELYCYNIISTMINHAVKLVPLRQLDGQRVLSDAANRIPQAVDTAMKVEYESLGMSGCGFDIRSMQHEKLYSRLFIS